VLRFQHEVVPGRGQDVGGHRLADVAAQALAVLVQQLAEALDAADAHQVVQFLARVREVFAQVVADGQPGLRHLGLHDLVTSGTQPPQAVPALVHFFSAPMSQAPPATASAIAPF
jgi:hypothetical protein